jgi:DNA-binding CsgD family transcriptional regulator
MGAKSRATSGQMHYTAVRRFSSKETNMSELHLSAAEVALLNLAQRVLLSPLTHEDPVDWQLCANDAVRRLLTADHSVFSMPAESGPTFITDDTDPTVPARFLSYHAGVEGGENRFRDPVMEESGRARRAAGTGAYHERMLGSVDALRRSVVYQEIFTPAGLTNLIGFSVPLPIGEATQFFSFEGPGGGLRSERGLDLLRLLVPAFEAGVRVQLARLARQAAFTSLIDRLGPAIAVYSTDGTPLHRTEPLRRLLDAEPEAERLRDHLNEVARALSTRHDRASSAPPLPSQWETQARMTTPTGDYRLLGSYLDVDLLGAEGVMVLVERLRPLFPSIPELIARLALTAREAEVALLLAEGLTDCAIAGRLGVSTNTARRYSERVLGKLGLHSRAAVAVTLLHAADGV